VLAAVNALGANQREMAMTLREVQADVGELKTDVSELKTGLSDTHARVRSLEDGVSEIKDLLVRALDRGGS
jgi:septal ring factor EnvC (AmiA/AmiB activator)